MMKTSRQLKDAVRTLSVATATLGLIAGCASTPAPTEQMALSRAALDTALSVGGNEHAPLQLQAAMNKMDAAEKALAKEDYAEARKLAEQAEVDAKLASAMARSAKAQKASEAVQDDIRVLRQEIDRNAK